MSGLDFNAAPGQSGPVKESHGHDNKFGHSGHSITSGQWGVVVLGLSVFTDLHCNRGQEARGLVQISLISSAWICEGSEPKPEFCSVGGRDQAEWQR